MVRDVTDQPRLCQEQILEMPARSPAGARTYAAGAFTTRARRFSGALALVLATILVAPLTGQAQAQTAKFPVLFPELFPESPAPGGPRAAILRSSHLVSNTGQTADATPAGGARDRAQAFTTGANSGGYTLSSVEFIYADIDGDDAAVSVCTVDVNGFPTSTCTALTAPSSFVAGTLEFTGNMTLAAGTTYTLLLATPGGETLQVGSTSSGGEDTGGATGWSIDDAYDFKNSSGDWGTTGSGKAFRIAVKGTVVGGTTPATAGVTLSKTSLTVTEADTTGDTYTVVLDSQPTASVTITVAGHASTAVSATPASLTFTTTNWSTAKTVTVTAVNDTNTANETVNLTHSATSTDSDYSGITIAGVTVTVNDNDTGNTAPTFGSTTAMRSVAENTAAGQNVGAVLTATDDDGDTLTYTLEGADAASFDLVTTTDPAAQIRTKTGVTYNHEVTPTYTVVVKADDGNSGTATVTVTITITDVNEPPGRPAAPSVEAVGGPYTLLVVEWEAPANTGPDIDTYDLRYQKTTESTWTNGHQDEPPSPSGAGFVIITGLDASTAYRVQVRATNAEGDSEWSPSGTGTTNAPPGVTLSKSTLTVTEQDTTGDTYTVVLDRQPTTNVVVTVAGHAGTDVTPTPTTLTFTSTTWNTPQPVTVTAADDSDTVNDTVSLTHTATSTDSGYSGITIDGVAVAVRDNDGSNIAPVFTRGTPQTRTLAETVGAATVGTAAGIGGAVSATDANFDTLDYSLGGTDAGKFDFDDSNGQISTKAGERYDYEANQRYSVTVTVNDGTVGVPAAVTINITNNTNETPLAPGAPTVTATSGSTTSLDVNWVAPANTGRPIITGYDLRYREAGTESWTDGPQDVLGTSASIPGLAAGASYEVQVRALNADGDGFWSLSGSARTAAPPTPTVRFGASAYTAIEGVAGAAVRVLLEPAASSAVTVPVTTTPQDGASSADYSGVPGSVTFAAGETEQTFIVTATEDTVDDDGESLQLGFDALPSGVLLGSPSTATVALVQDAGVSTWYVWFGESSYTATEGGAATISVHLNSPWKPERNEALTVPLFDPQHQGGASADDYSGLPESVTFQPGQTRASFTLRVTEDSEDDDGESVLIGFRRLFPDDLEVGRYGPHKTTLHIADNDGEKAVTVSFAAANYTAAEGGATATVGLRLSAAPGRTVTIPLTPTNREATAADYSGVPGSVTFGASETEKSFTLTATDDSQDDARESVVISFGSLPSKVSAGSPSEAVVQLTDNDSVVSRLQVSFDASAGAVRDGVEEGGAYSLGFSLSTKPGQTLTIPLTYTYLGGATAADFSGLPANVTFGENAKSARVTIRPVDDFEDDPGESLKVSFGTLPGGVSVSSWSGRSTIIPVIDDDAPPGLSVADASAREWPNKKVCLNFVVTMDRMDVDHEVSVDYATANGTAVAGQDFKPISGTLVFRPSESRRRTASKSLCVEVLDDSHDEGVEEMTLRLSNPVRAFLADGTATGSISNTDKMPGAWLARFGRTVADHVVDAVSNRWQGEASAENHLTIGGRQAGELFGWTGLGGQAGQNRGDTPDGPVLDETDAMGLMGSSGFAGVAPTGTDSGFGSAGRNMNSGTDPAMSMNLNDRNTAPAGPSGVDRAAGATPGSGATLGGRAAQSALLRALGLPDPRAGTDLRAALMGSSFFYSRAPDEDGEAWTPGWLGEWSAWGRTAATRFSGADGGLSLDGEAATAILGIDSRWNRWLAGVVVSYSEGQGAYTHPTASGGDLASSLTALHPYARYELDERTSFWGVLGYGVGELSLTPERSGTALKTDLTNAMAAFGGQTALSVRSGRAGQFELALRSDARLTSMASETIEGLAGAEGQTSRVRLMLEGTGSMPLAFGGVLAPTLEAGLRYDAGDAETGAGLEVGGGLGYAGGGLSVEVNARGLLAHQDSEYEEWGFSGSIAYIPGKNGRGLSMRLGSAWGATQSGVQSLWNQQDASELGKNVAFEAAQRFEAELGYGIAGRRGNTLWVPLIAAQAADGGGQSLRMGLKLNSGPNLEAGLELGRRQGHPGADPEHAVQFRGALRW